MLAVWLRHIVIALYVLLAGCNAADQGKRSASVLRAASIHPDQCIKHMLLQICMMINLLVGEVHLLILKAYSGKAMNPGAVQQERASIAHTCFTQSSNNCATLHLCNVCLYLFTNQRACE